MPGVTHETKQGIILMDETAEASPKSTAAALKSIAELTRESGRSIAVLGELDMPELGTGTAFEADRRDEYDRVGRLAVRLNIKKLIVVGNEARHIHNAAGLEGSWNGESELVADAQAAYEALAHDLRAGDIVLVAASGSSDLTGLVTRLARDS